MQKEKIMFKISLFKMIGSAALALTLSTGLVAPVAFAAGSTTVAACATPTWTGVNAKTTEQGLMITDVVKGSPAAVAGLAVNEILLSVNGKGISSQADLDQFVAGAKVGDMLSLEIARQGGMMYKMVVTLGKNADKPFLGLKTEQVPVEIGPFTYVETGAASCTSKPFELSSDVARGLFVTSVDQTSAAAKAGLAMGDVILDVNGKPAGTPDNLTKTVSSLKSGDTLNLSLYNLLNKKTSTIKVTLGDKPALGAQVAVIVEGAMTYIGSSTYGRNGNNSYGRQDILQTIPTSQLSGQSGQIFRIVDYFRLPFRWLLENTNLSVGMNRGVFGVMTSTPTSQRPSQPGQISRLVDHFRLPLRWLLEHTNLGVGMNRGMY
jgi:PDZ domain